MLFVLNKGIASDVKAERQHKKGKNKTIIRLEDIWVRLNTEAPLWTPYWSSQP
jgi:hypothetical protein